MIDMLSREEDKMQTLVYLMGGTCTGKSTFIRCAKEHYGDTAGFVEVGKRLREKYPPEYFKGSAAPDHTEREALDLYLSEANALLDKHDLVFVDGQPRRESQVEVVLNSFSTIPKVFLLFHASAEVQAVRAGQRFVRDPKSFELAIARIDNDRKQGYDCLVALLKNNMTVNVVESTVTSEQLFTHAAGIMEGIQLQAVSQMGVWYRSKGLLK